MFFDVDGSINDGDADTGEEHRKSEIARGSVVDVDACTSVGVDADTVVKSEGLTDWSADTGGSVVDVDACTSVGVDAGNKIKSVSFK